ncbi:MAG TPA: hypothetical protein VJP59_05945 [Gemmatimonadota bacterium]|nr:hypothetical protein [Gemmatimonadota bacterium]
MSYKPTLADRHLDEQSMSQVDLDGALLGIEGSYRMILRSLRLAVGAKDWEEARDYLATASEALRDGVQHKELARIAAGNIAVATLELRRLHLVPTTSKYAEAVPA